jgi:hypothetical protein
MFTIFYAILLGLVGLYSGTLERQGKKKAAAFVFFFGLAAYCIIVIINEVSK